MSRARARTGGGGARRGTVRGLLHHPAALLLVLVGLLGMHGLAGHGTSGGEHGAVTHAAAAVTGPGDAHAAHGAHAAQDDHDPAPAALPVSDADAGHGAGLLGLCLAVLVAAVVLLALRYGRVLTAPRRAGAPAQVVLGRTGRAPDPPSRYRLSVMRC